MQTTLEAWLAHFTSKRGEAKTEATPYEHQGYYFNAEDWCASHRLLLDHMSATSTISARRHYARQTLRRFNLHAALREQDPALFQAIDGLAGDTTHGNADRRTYTLWHIDGARVEGNRRELLAATGLSMDRLKDLLGGRRRLVKGWCLTEGEARRGRLPPGAKRKKAPEPRAVVQADDLEGAALLF